MEHINTFQSELLNIKPRMRLTKLQIKKKQKTSQQRTWRQAIETIKNETLRKNIKIIINYKESVILGTIYEGLLKCNWNLWRSFNSLKKKVAKFFQKSQFSEPQSARNMKKTIPWHTTIKLFKTSDKENNNLKTAREKHIT